jgi:methionyl aminopeptidase
LLKVTEGALQNLIPLIKPGITVGTIGAWIEKYVKDSGFFINRDFAGHGIGKNLHEDPLIPNYGTKNAGMKLQTGMVICIEPMVLLDTEEIMMMTDNWTINSKTNCWTAHAEDTILITETGCEILTKRKLTI